MPTLQELLTLINETEKKRADYVRRTDDKLQKLNALVKYIQTAKYRVGQALFNKKDGNVVVIETILRENKLVYKCVGTKGNGLYFQDELLPINLATEALFGNNK
jgi:hypothetical protein